MRLPKGFLPKKKLEEKIEQLVKGSKTFRDNEKNKVTKEELEEVLKYFKGMVGIRSSTEIHKQVKELIIKNNYTKRNYKNANLEYWIKKDPLDIYATQIFIAHHQEYYDTYSYSFARVEKSNLEKFCHRFEKCCKIESMFHHHSKFNDIFDEIAIKGLAIGFFAGGIGGAVGSFYLFGVPFLSLWTPLVLSVGALVGCMALPMTFFTGMYGLEALAQKGYKKYKKKNHSLCEYIVTDSKKAIIESLK